MGEPWTVLGWLLVTCLGACLGLAGVLVVGVLLVAVHHALRASRDSRRWNVERPVTTLWRQVTVEKGVLRLHLLRDGDATAQVIGDPVTHRLQPDAAAQWLRSHGWRLHPLSEWDRTR